ncbi:hypothetical protein AXK60_05840 [Tsukamurella pseudospumae]|uniref:Uncharacterized protein n=1 Tax=Tsukamurella pseudospumae TaxID=239498 RepID=A0A138AKA7_9ACTN|nr:hypothetical protein AXK61_07975 [Tsukamurella pseudospumae]KXP10802.1 hypothetical protein AXK60_05840 [Tsukamurella pseudospumae]
MGMLVLAAGCAPDGGGHAPSSSAGPGPPTAVGPALDEYTVPAIGDGAPAVDVAFRAVDGAGTVSLRVRGAPESVSVGSRLPIDGARPARAVYRSLLGDADHDLLVPVGWGGSSGAIEYRVYRAGGGRLIDRGQISTREFRVVDGYLRTSGAGGAGAMHYVFYVVPAGAAPLRALAGTVVGRDGTGRTTCALEADRTDLAALRTSREAALAYFCGSGRSG